MQIGWGAWKNKLVLQDLNYFTLKGRLHVLKNQLLEQPHDVWVDTWKSITKNIVDIIQ